MPVRTGIIPKAAGPGLLDRSRRRPDALLARAAAAAVAGLLLGWAGAGPVGWWATVAGLSLLALSTHRSTIPSAIVAGSTTGAVALGVWLPTGTTETTMTATTLAIGVSAVAGAAYGLVARTLQNWPAWPATLPAVWLAIEASTEGVFALPRVDPVAIAQIASEQTAGALALASGPAVVYLLGLASCCLALAVAGMARWAQARTVVGCLAAALASLGVLLTMEAAIHAHDFPPTSSMPADIMDPVRRESRTLAGGAAA